jgi:hypothetical protein
LYFGTPYVPAMTCCFGRDCLVLSRLIPIE